MDTYAHRLEELPREEVERNKRIYRELLRELYPDIANFRGPIYDLVVYTSALYAACNQHDVNQAIRGMFLGDVLANPEGVSPPLLDRLAKNWLVERRKGAIASGRLKIYLNRPFSFVIPVGATFSVGHSLFRTKRPFTVHDVVLADPGPGDLFLEPSGNEWVIVVPVEAALPGYRHNLKQGTKLATDHRLPKHVNRVVASEDFSGGLDEETNTQLANRLMSGPSAKGWSNRINTKSILWQQPPFDRLLGVAVIGYGDPEMRRDRHGAWPGSVGGKVDIYAKPPGGVVLKEVTVDARLLRADDTFNFWDFTIPREEAAGWYRIRKLGRPEGSRETHVVDIQRNCDDPDIDAQYHNEAAFSAAQSARVQFQEKHLGSPSAPDTVQRFKVTLDYVPGLLELQRFVMDRRNASPAGDILVKAPVPCFVTTTITLEATRFGQPVNTARIQELVADKINKTGFGCTLAAADITALVHPLVGRNATIKQVSLEGMLLQPDGTMKYIPPGDVLKVEEIPEKMVSARTVTFFQEPSAVHVKVLAPDGAL